MVKITSRAALAVLLFAITIPLLAAEDHSYEDLVELFEDWREFEQPPLLNGAPDYTAATTATRHSRLFEYQSSLDAFDISAWPVDQQVDWWLVKAEMNGMDFNIRVLKPWLRDPAYYTSIWTFRSDTPAHEGPNHHAVIDTWRYDYPLDDQSAAELAGQLRTIAPLLAQARGNLTGNAAELWIAGIDNLRGQAEALAELAQVSADAGEAFNAALVEAREATDAFIAWLEAESAAKTGPSGIGIENYTWQLQNVHLVPLSWEDEVRLLQRELDRALSSLALEEHRNRNLPADVAIATEAEYLERTEADVIRFRDFLVNEQVLPPYDYIEPALRDQMGSFVPEDQRNFFLIVSHYDPLALWTHWYHWFDLARMEADPHTSPIRRGPLLYNIWDSRAEGMATAFEEMAMRAGLFDDDPRSRELVWIMLAQRAARGLGSLYAQANMFSLKEARDFHVKWTPRGWMREDLDLLGFEQLLYLRQPGYGTSYVTGKYLLDGVLGRYARQKGEDFTLAGFYGDLDQIGVIPVSLIQWQLNGEKSSLFAPVEAK